MMPWPVVSELRNATVAIVITITSECVWFALLCVSCFDI